jgi:hypothetical protein
MVHKDKFLNKRDQKFHRLTYEYMH